MDDEDEVTEARDKERGIDEMLKEIDINEAIAEYKRLTDPCAKDVA